MIVALRNFYWLTFLQHFEVRIHIAFCTQDQRSLELFSRDNLQVQGLDVLGAVSEHCEQEVRTPLLVVWLKDNCLVIDICVELNVEVAALDETQVELCAVLSSRPFGERDLVNAHLILTEGKSCWCAGRKLRSETTMISLLVDRILKSDIIVFSSSRIQHFDSVETVDAESGLFPRVES